MRDPEVAAVEPASLAPSVSIATRPGLKQGVTRSYQ